MNRDFFIGTTSVQGSVYHAGILFLNGAGFWVRVTGQASIPIVINDARERKSMSRSRPKYRFAIYIETDGMERIFTDIDT
ncbi:hypothetical protein FS594_27140 (plasmid) [Rahnella aquatilis]|nr:hypothetical protein FS594_27140 [Rahnella aquatilis]